jgi:hypothetical protein
MQDHIGTDPGRTRIPACSGGIYKEAAQKNYDDFIFIISMH